LGIGCKLIEKNKEQLLKPEPPFKNEEPHVIDYKSNWRAVIVRAINGLPSKKGNH
jgi:hypothetical protein